MSDTPRVVPLPPLPQPGTCRWCYGPTRTRGAWAYCIHSQCAADPRALADVCQTCGGEYHTGARTGGVCWQCDNRQRVSDDARVTAMHAALDALGGQP